MIGRLVLLAVFCVALTASTTGQIRLSPHSLFLTGSNRSATLTLTSSVDSAMTVELQPHAQQHTLSGDPLYSCAPWITCTPARIELSPRGTASVQLTLSSPGSEKEAEYHARIVCVAADQMGEAKEVAKPVAVYYRKGDVYSDVKLAGVSVERGDGEIHFLFTLEQLGNAPYRGNLALRIQNGAGTSILKKELTVDIFERGVIRETLPAEQVPKGTYRILMNFNSDRVDLGDRAIPVLPKKFKVDIRMS